MVSAFFTSLRWGFRGAFCIYLVATLLCSSNAAFPHPKPISTAASNANKCPTPSVSIVPIKSGHDGRNDAWLLTASSREQNPVFCKSLSLVTTMKIPYGGEIASNGADGVSGPHTKTREEHVTSTDERKGKSIVKAMLQLHLYLAALCHSVNYPVVAPAVITVGLIQLIAGELNVRRFAVAVLLVSNVGSLDKCQTNCAMGILLGTSTIEAAILWVQKDLKLNDWLMAIPLTISLVFFAYK